MMLSTSILRYLIVVFVALGSLTYGYSSSIISTTLGQPSFIKYFDMNSRSNANDISGAINGVFQAGGLIGTLSCHVLADWLGRRKALLFAASISIIGGALQAGSVNISMFIAGRFIGGISIGALVALVPLYQSEIAPPRIRGFLVGTHGALIGGGYALAGWVGFGIYFATSEADWRIPLAIQCAPPLCLSMGILLLPESPRWLLLRGQVDKAFLAFKATRAESSDEILDNDELMKNEFELLHSQTSFEAQHTVPFKHFYSNKSVRKRCIVGFLTTFGCQCTATIVINNYGPLLYKSLGFGTVQQLLLESAWVTVAFFGNIVNALLVDHIGRVRMLLIGFTGCAVALIGECITVAIFSNTGKDGAASGAVVFLFLHVAIFTLCCDATSYIYASEIFPTPIRAKGLSISISGLFVSTVIFTTAAPTAFANIGWKYYILFIVLTSLIIVYVAIHFPETRKKSLEDIEVLFGVPTYIGSQTSDISDTLVAHQSDFDESPSIK